MIPKIIIIAMGLWDNNYPPGRIGNAGTPEGIRTNAPVYRTQFFKTSD